MEKEIIFREINQGEETNVSRMIIDCFKEFIAPDYGSTGVAEFEKYVEPNRIRERLEHGSFMMAAFRHGQIVGVIEVRSYNHISLLFVDKKHQRRGTSKKLLESAVGRCKQHNRNLGEVEVNSSPFAVPIYEKLGFIKTGSEQIVNGIRFTPMVLKLNQSS